MSTKRVCLLPAKGLWESFLKEEAFFKQGLRRVRVWSFHSISPTHTYVVTLTHLHAHTHSSAWTQGGPPPLIRLKECIHTQKKAVDLVLASLQPWQWGVLAQLLFLFPPAENIRPVKIIFTKRPWHTSWEPHSPPLQAFL